MLIIPAFLCIYYIIIRPQVTGIAWSFYNMQGYKITTFAGLDNFKRILSDNQFYTTLFNTIKYVIWSLLVGFVLPIIIAVMLNEAVHMRNTFKFLLYFPSVLPGVAVTLLWYLVYSPDESGLLNMMLTKIGFAPYTWLQDANWTILYIVISMTWTSAGATALYYFASLQGVSRDLYEAAVIDGAGFFKRLWHITLPHMSGIILLMLIRQIIGVFSIMEQPMQMTDGGPNGASLTLGLLSYRYGFVNGRPQLAMAVGVVMFIILMVITCFYYALDKKISDNK